MIQSQKELLKSHSIEAANQQTKLEKVEKERDVYMD